MKVAILFDHFGPYHLARLRGALARCGVLGIEVHGLSREYAWELADRQGVPLVTLAHDAQGRLGVKASADSSEEEAATSGTTGSAKVYTPTPTPAPATDNSETMVKALHAALRDYKPDAVALPGWSSVEAMAALRWCLEHRIPAILMSESAEHDEARVVWKEFVKRRIVGLYATGLCGGSRHVSYLKSLGMPEDRIFGGYDVVDNAHFAPRGDRAVGTDPGEARPFFLASARFVEKKNLPTLLRAYASYRKAAGADAWNLELLGDGPLRPVLTHLISELGLADAVSLPGFRQYEELPAYYARAAAFIHASSTEQWGLVVNEAMAAGLPVLVSERCGCAPELVHEGVNGYSFDPQDVDALARCLTRMAGLAPEERQRMGRASLEIVARHGPEQFGEGLLQAAQKATSLPQRSLGWLDEKLLRFLSRK